MLCSHVPPTGMPTNAATDSCRVGVELFSRAATSGGDQEAIALHITTFSLGGMRAMAQQQAKQAQQAEQAQRFKQAQQAEKVSP